MAQVKINNYVFDMEQVLGKGSTGTVYLGVDTRNNKKVAVKVIELKNITNQVTKYLLENEVKALQISNHPNVLKAYDVAYDSDCCYVITNYCPNNTLEHYIKARGRIPEQEAIKIFKEIVDGYTNLQVNKILHRDLKPSNILFSERFEPVICDFGYCQISGFLPKPKLNYNVGSPAYMAPESITKNMYSQSSEIWSLGTILYQMLQGRSFAHGRQVMQAVMQIKKKGPYVPDGASQFSRKIIKQCMALHPNDRMKLKELSNMLRSGRIQNPQSDRVPQQPRFSHEIRPATHSISHLPNNDHLQHLRLAQQQLLQHTNQSTRRTVQTQRQIQYPNTQGRNTLPLPLTNVTRARSNQPLSPQQLMSQIPQNRVSTLPPQQVVRRQNTMPNQHMTNSIQDQIIVNNVPTVRPSTSFIPFRPGSNFSINMNESYQVPTIQTRQQIHNRIFINPEDQFQLTNNSSFRTQPSFINKIQDMNLVASLPSGGSSMFGRETMSGNTNRNTIQSINSNLLNHKVSIRKFEQPPAMLVSTRSNSSHISQQQIAHQYQSANQRGEFIRKIVQQQQQQQQQSPMRPVSVNTPQMQQRIIQPFQQIKKIQTQQPPSTYQQIQQLQQNQSPQSPFLKTPASKVYSPISQFPQNQQQIRSQKLQQLNHPNLINHLSKRKPPINQPVNVISSQIPQPPKQLPQRMTQMNYPPIQRPISVVSNRRYQ